MKRLSLYIILLLAAILPQTAMAQNDKEAMLRALGPVILKYENKILAIDSTKFFNNLFNKYKKDPRTLTQMALLFYEGNNPNRDAANRIEERIIKMYPNYGYVYTVRGVGFANHGETEKGLEIMRKGIDMSPNDPDCYKPYVDLKLASKHLAHTHKDSLEVRQMVDSLAAHVTDVEDRIKVMDMLARFSGSLSAQSTLNAISDGISYEKMSKERLQTYLNGLVKAGNHDRTQPVLDKALALYPQDPYIHQLAFTHYNNKHDYDNAALWANKYFSEVPADSLGYNDYRMYAACLNAKGDFKGAIENLWKAYNTAEKKYNQREAFLLNGHIAKDMRTYTKEQATKILDSDGLDKSLESFRFESNDFLAHNNEYQSDMAIDDMVEFVKDYAERIDTTGSAANKEKKALAYIKAKDIYKETEIKETDPVEKNKRFFLQWLMVRNAVNVDRQNYPAKFDLLSYTNELFNRGLAMDEPVDNYLYNPLVDLQVFYDSPEQIPVYAQRIKEKFPDYDNPNIDKLMQGVPRALAAKYSRAARAAGMTYREYLAANNLKHPLDEENSEDISAAQTTTTSTKTTKAKAKKTTKRGRK